jgi:hypothetical protein
MMSIEDWRDVLGDGVAVSMDLAAAPSARPATASDAAARLLDAIAVLEDGPLAHAKKEEPSAEFQRLELKIDLLTDLVCSLLSDRIPRPLRLWVSGAGLVLPASVLAPGSERVELYPSQWLAQPLILEIGPVICRGGDCGAAWRSIDRALRDALERWVFRMHRREVARQRMKTGGARLP